MNLKNSLMQYRDAGCPIIFKNYHLERTMIVIKDMNDSLNDFQTVALLKKENGIPPVAAV